jgi:hypothetical protein
MGVTPSSRWPVVTLDLEDVSLKPSGVDEAMRLAGEAQSGTLAATGEAGDCVEMQFDQSHALVLYMATDQRILRPHFPHRQETGEGVEAFFCECCGVQLGDKAEAFRKCMARGEAMRLCREILRGRLPGAIPEPGPKQPFLPGMESRAVEEAEWGLVEWRPLKPRRSGSAEQAASADRPSD